MPFKGMNRKAAEAKEKEIAKKLEQKQKAAKKEEDEKWTITDKKEIAELKKKQDASEKLEADSKRKQDLKKLYNEEQAALDNKLKPKTKVVTGTPVKLSRAEIQQRLILQNTLKQKREAAVEEVVRKEEVAGEALIQNFDTENWNAQQKRLASDVQDVQIATDIDEALQVFELEDEISHPEKRRKAAFQQYLQEEMPKLREERPNLRQQQYRNILFKQFQKSMSNPVYAAKVRADAAK
eukprot:GHVH01014186.1.p2 GENE.GHVH01014186.1~~GHVH01014186.1.p2  ORF type:complete len:238 (+),score=69.33 GHVH01014186.1:139-852(+)